MKNEDIMVSICCMTYNQEAFLRQALDSFLMQKTNFKIEIIVHDDASTDNTPNIIKEYEKKYPDIVKPIYEEKNQYCDGAKSLMNLFEKAKGRYIAICEGDDYWCDEYKIQKQYDFMQKNKECSMCVHNTRIHDLNNKEEDRNFNDWLEIKELTEYDVFFGWHVHTSSYFIRKEYAIYPKEFWKCWCGDYVFLTVLYFWGKIICLPDVMSVYNNNNKQGVTYQHIQDAKNRISKIASRKEYLEKYNSFTKGKFQKIVYERICELEFAILLDEMSNFKYSFKEFKEKRQKLRENEFYKKYLKQVRGIKKTIFYAKLNLYSVNKIYKKLKKFKNFMKRER